MPKGKQHIKPWAIIFWIAVWQIGSMALKAAFPHGALLLPSPVAALTKLFELCVTTAFWRTVGLSGAHILGGFLLSCALGVVCAALSARFRRVEELFSPLVAIIKAVPVASFIILALVWLNSRNLSLFISALMVFPPIYLNVLEGIRSADKALLEMAEVFRVSFWARVRGIYLPHVLPHFRSAVSAALGLCWKAGTAAEVIGMSTGSIGERLYTAKIYFETAELFAWTAVIVMISAAFERLFIALTDKLAERLSA